MTIARARVLPYAIALRAPLVTSAATVDHRHGFLFELGGSGHVDRAGERGRDGAVARGYGEAAPVWWLGEDTIEATGAALARAAELFSGAQLEAHAWLELLRALDDDAVAATHEVPDGAAAGADRRAGRGRADRGGDRCAALSRAWSLWPASVRSAVVTAVLDIEARTHGLCVAEVLADGRVPTRLATSRLLAGDDERALETSAAAAVAAGFESVKLKVGAHSADRDVARLRRVRDAVGAGVAIRLDANRAWAPCDARAALEAMARFGPQLVEEPLRDPEPRALARLREDVAVPIALDESIVTREDLDRSLDVGAFDFLVVKLGRVGGPLRALALASVAARHGVATIVTDAIETRVGQAAVLHVAAALPGRAYAVGLGGAALLVNDGVAACTFAEPLVTLPGPGLAGRLGAEVDRT